MTRNKRNNFILLIILPLFVIQFGCTRETPKQAILILLDAARPDHFSCYGYDKPTTPEIDRIASQGILFENCFTQGTFTRSALPSLIYSRYYAPNMFPYNPFVPLYNPEELFRDIDRECISFPRVLELSDILTAGISSHDYLKPETRFAQEFMLFYDLLEDHNFSEEYPYPEAEKVVDSTIDWIKKNKNNDYFLYMHLMDTHLPHHFTEDAQAFFGADSYDASRFLEGGWLSQPGEYNQEDLRYLNALYDGSLRSVDRQLGRLFKYLTDTGRIDSTLILITSDHGESLIDREDRIGHGGEWYDEVARIPLIVHFPKKIGPQKIDGLTEMVDIGPTILGLLDVQYPRGKTPDGIDLSPLIKGLEKGRELVRISGGIRTDRFKTLFETPDHVLLADVTPEFSEINGKLYDLEEDAGERKNLFAAQETQVMKLLTSYRSHMKPLFKRAVFARTERPPNSPFAITSRHFQIDQDIPSIPYDLLPEKILDEKSPNGWYRSDHPDYYWLLTGLEADPLKIEIPVPSGSYNLFVDMNGACQLTVGDVTQQLRSRPYSPNLPWPLQQVEFGNIEIEDNTFKATISVSSKRPWFGLRLFGFEPESSMDRNSPDYKRRMERLKALGYIK